MVVEGTSCLIGRLVLLFYYTIQLLDLNFSRVELLFMIKLVSSNQIPPNTRGM